MATLSYPGVYVQEVSSGVRPIQAAGTSTAAFVGVAEMGPTSDAVRVINWTEFQKIYGGFINDSKLAHSVFQFFNNGGQQCYIARVARSDAATASVNVNNRQAPAIAGVTFSAKNQGAWGNYVYLQIEDGSRDPGNEFRVSVRRQTEVDVVPANFLDIPPLEVHDNLSMDPDARNYVEKVLAANSSLINATVLAANKTNAALQRGFHRSGNNPATPVGPPAQKSFQINVDYDGFQSVSIATGLADLAAVATAIQTAVQALTKLKASTKAEAFTAFTCTVVTDADGSRLLLQSGSNTGAGTENALSSVRVQDSSPAADNAAVALKLGGANGGTSSDGVAVRRPANASSVQIGDSVIAAPVAAAQLGTDGTAALGVASFTNAFTRLDNKTDFSLLGVPGENVSAIVDAGMAYCANRPLSDVFYIGETTQDDTPENDTPTDAATYRASLTKPNSYGAVYYPWVLAADPTGKSAQPILLPPSGYMAGLYAQTDAKRGVWKAPAGTEASLSGALGLARNLSDVEHGNLNLININCLRRFPAAGIVSFGARTISSDPEWRYVPVRRTAIMLRVSIYNGIQWAVFEPNDEPLYAQLRLNITSFMMTLYRQGAFQGSTPSQAFFVKCDRETTTQDDVNNGVVNVLVGFAPLKPAEFVVVKISQKAGQTA